jgi:hypothetical protein
MTYNQRMLALIEAKLEQYMAPDGVKRCDIAESSMSRYVEHWDLDKLNEMRALYKSYVAQEEAASGVISPLATLTGVMR